MGFDTIVNLRGSSRVNLLPVLTREVEEVKIESVRTSRSRERGEREEGEVK